MRYDLETQSWEQSPTELELPEGVLGFSAVTMQTRFEWYPPVIVLRHPDGAISRRALNRDGSDCSCGAGERPVGKFPVPMLR